MGGAGHQEQLALGDVPNIASRIQGLAAPNTVIISGATHRLVQGYFAIDELGLHPLKGVAEPIPIYRVTADADEHSRFDVVRRRGLSPLVGREDEIAMLRRRWTLCTGEGGQAVLVNGEGGIGKSRLVEVMRENAAADGCAHRTFRCSSYHTNSTLYPVIEHLEQCLSLQPGEGAEQKLSKLEELLATNTVPPKRSVPLLAALLGLDCSRSYSPLHLTPQQQRQQTLNALVSWLLAETKQEQRVLTVWEDLHWADPSTVELLGLLIEQLPSTRMLGLLTFRPEFHPPWAMASHLSQLTLNPFGPSQVERLATHVAGDKRLPAPIVSQIVAQTDGVPLFVEELTKSVLESQLLQKGEDRYELLGALRSLTIPTTLQDALMARLDRLDTAKTVAQIAATLGRTFAYRLLQEVAELDGVRLGRALRSLVDAELLYQRGIPPEANYTFKHALIQEAAYQSLLKSARQQIHKRVVQTLEGQFLETVEGQPELLAHHCAEAGMNQEAVGYLQRAGQRAVERSASREAMTHFSRALEILASVPENAERSRQEVDLLLALGAASHHATGQSSSDTERAYAQALARSRGSRDPSQLFHSLSGQAAVYRGRAQFLEDYQVCQEMLALAREHGDPTLLFHAHVTLCQSSFYLGRFFEASEHLHHQLGLYPLLPDVIPLKIPVAMDPRVLGLIFGAWALWLLGYPDQAMTRGQQCIALARQTSHAHNIAFSRLIAARLHEYRGEPDACLAHAEVVIAVASENDLPQRLGSGLFIRGSALATKGETQKGLAQMREGMALWRATGAQALHTYYRLRIAEVYGLAGDAAQGLRVIEETLMALDRYDERFCEAELYRIKGRLVLLRSAAEEEMAEACFLKGLETARHQGAKSLELRAAMDLARLWLRQGKVKQAHDLLAPVYNWFTEGFETADLNEARALIDAFA
jgi:predicted ATPase